MAGDDFVSASSYLSSATTLKLSSSTRLSLYSLYKLASTGLPSPPGPRPAIWDFEGRAKWDAWKAKGLELERTEGGQGEAGLKERAEREYVASARELGWSGGRASSTATVGSGTTEATADRPTGMVVVSKMAAPPPEGAPSSRSRLHDLAIDGDVDALRLLSHDARAGLDVDARDGEGYTPLHLASDGGHLAFVRLLLDLGADPSSRDGDELTAEELASEAGRPDVVELLRARTK